MKDEVLRRIDQRRPTRSGDSSATVLIALQNVDKVDGLDASDIPRPGMLLALNSEGKFPASVLPTAQAEGAEGFAGLTIFGTGLSYLMEAIDGNATSIKVYHRAFVTDQYIWLKPAFADDEKMKITNDGLKIEGGWEYTVNRTVDERGTQSFSRGQSVIGIGAVDEGYIVFDTRAQYSDRPFIDIIERIGDTAWGHRTRTRIGNLEGLTRNGIDTLTNPTGWGIWTENLYARGEFYAGYPGGPEVRIRRRTLGNGQSVHGMEWLYTPSARWWVQWYNETNQRVYWSVRKPGTPGSPEMELIRLIYRQGDPGLGEPEGWDYFLSIDATTIIGELIAGKAKIRGRLDAAVGDFGIIRTAALYLATADYNDVENRSGFYAWAYQLATEWFGEQGFQEDKGFEFWHLGVRQGRWNYDFGRLAFGPDDDVYLSYTGLGLKATDSPGIIATERDITWTDEDGNTVVRHFASATNTQRYLGVELSALDIDKLMTWAFRFRYHNTSEGDISFPWLVASKNVDEISPDIYMYYRSLNLNGLQASGHVWSFIDPLYIDTSIGLPQTASGTVPYNMANRQIAVGRQAITGGIAHVIKWATLNDTLESNMMHFIGIDQGTGRLVFQTGGTTYYIEPTGTL